MTGSETETGDEEAKQGHEQTVALFNTLVTTLYDKASAYLNVITVGGYAAYFGLWGLLGNEISLWERLWSATLIGISVLLFVGFEITKIAVLHWQLRTMRKITRSNHQTFDAAMKSYEAGSLRASQIGLAIWLFVYPAAVFFGLAGASFLIWAFIRKLMAME